MCVCVYVCLSFSTSERIDQLYETWYKRYDTGVHIKALIFKFLQSALTRWQHEFMRWEQRYKHFFWSPETMCGG